jgi:hypothetical protein
MSKRGLFQWDVGKHPSKRLHQWLVNMTTPGDPFFRGESTLHEHTPEEQRANQRFFGQFCFVSVVVIWTVAWLWGGWREGWPTIVAVAFTFVKSFFCASGIRWSVSPLWVEGSAVASLFVRQCDYERAKGFIDDFRSNGKRTTE